MAVEAVAAFKAWAQRALACAGRLPPDEMLFFSEIVEKAGRLAELLLMNRVRVNLERLHGLGDASASKSWTASRTRADATPPRPRW